MSQSDSAHFHPGSAASGDNNPAAAELARQRIASLTDTYANQAPANKEELAGNASPVSPAAETPEAQAASRLHITQAVASGAQATKEKVEALTASAVDVAATTAGRHSPKSAKKRGVPSMLKPAITGIITFVLLFLVFKAPIFWNQLGYLTSKSKTNTDTPASTDAPAAAVGSAPAIVIPKINVNAPLVFASDNAEAAIQTDLETGVVHYANTALPGQNGNSVLFGHSSNDWWEPGNYKFVFVLLDKLAVGDTFSVNYNSKQYIYKVAETKVVEPTDVSVLAQSTTPQMTIITCTPPGTSWKRLVVRADQISPSPTAATETNVNSSQGTGLDTLSGNSPSFTQKIGNWWHSFTSIFTGNKDKTSTTPAATQPNTTTLPDAK